MATEVGMLTLISSSNTFIQTNVDEDMRGRVISYFLMAFAGMQPIGALLVGAAAHIAGAQVTVLIQGLAGIIVILSFIPSLRKTYARAERKALRVRNTAIEH